MAACYVNDVSDVTAPHNSGIFDLFHESPSPYTRIHLTIWTF